MHAGKPISAAIAVIFLLSAPSAHANKKSAKKRADDPAPAAAETSKAKTAAKPKSAKQPALRQSKRKRSKPGVSKRRVAGKNASETRPAKASNKAEDIDLSGLDEDLPWWEQPIATRGKNTKTPAKKKSGRASNAQKYGGRVGLGSRTKGEPTVAEDKRVRGNKLSRRAVVAVVRANKASVGYCSAGARHSGENETQLILRFKVDTAGRAGSVRVSSVSGVKARAMTRCMATRMKSWKFPSGTIGGEIEYPLMVHELGPSSSK